MTSITCCRKGKNFTKRIRQSIRRKSTRRKNPSSSSSKEENDALVKAAAEASAAAEAAQSKAVVGYEVLEESRAVARRKSSHTVAFASEVFSDGVSSSCAADTSGTFTNSNASLTTLTVRRKKSSGNSVTFAEDAIDKMQLNSG